MSWINCFFLSLSCFSSARGSALMLRALPSSTPSQAVLRRVHGLELQRISTDSISKEETFYTTFHLSVHLISHFMPFWRWHWEIRIHSSIHINQYGPSCSTQVAVLQLSLTRCDTFFCSVSLRLSQLKSHLSSACEQFQSIITGPKVLWLPWIIAKPASLVDDCFAACLLPVASVAQSPWKLPSKRLPHQSPETNRTGSNKVSMDL